VPHPAPERDVDAEIFARATIRTVARLRGEKFDATAWISSPPQPVRKPVTGAALLAVARRMGFAS
jgi:hypothetical protein